MEGLFNGDFNVTETFFFFFVSLWLWADVLWQQLRQTSFLASVDTQRGRLEVPLDSILVLHTAVLESGKKLLAHGVHLCGVSVISSLEEMGVSSLK